MTGEQSLARQQEHDTSTELTDACATPTSFDQWDGIPDLADQSSITAPDEGSTISGSILLEDGVMERDTDDLSKSYKNRARCLQLINDTAALLRRNLEDISSKSTELHKLFQEQLDHVVVLAALDLDESILDLEHILEEKISIMEQLKSSLGMFDIQKESPKRPPVAKLTPQRMQENDTGELTEVSDELPELSTGTPSNPETPSTEFDRTSSTHGYKPAILWNISPSEVDPFVDTPQKVTVETSLDPMKLTFHPDFVNLPGRKLYEPWIDDESAENRSRQVILNNLPPDATLAQVAKGVRCYGGIIAINMMNTSPFFGNTTKSAIVEFVYQSSAAEYADAVQSCQLIYTAKSGDKYRASAWLVPSPSYAYSYSNRLLLERGQTRALLLKKFPKQGVWYFLSAIGLYNIVDVKYDRDVDELLVEFSTFFHADRVQRLIWNGMFSDICYTIPGDSIFWSIANDSSLVHCPGFKYEGETIEHVSAYSLHGEWNRKPFNEYWPTERMYVMQFQGLGPLAALAPRPSTTERLAALYDIEEDEVEDYLEERQNYKNTKFRILGSTITLTRRKWGWSITEDDETKLLMANTLHDPEWATEWDEYFKARGEVNLRTWEQYGMLAKHRREKAEEQGIDAGKVPVCQNCGNGCGDLKSMPVPAIVKNFLDFSKITIVDTDE